MCTTKIICHTPTIHKYSYARKVKRNQTETLNETNTLNPRHNALNPWHTVKPAYAYAYLSIALKETIRPMLVCPMHKP